MKRISLISVLLIISLFLFGCNQSDPTPTNPAKIPTAAPTKTTEPTDDLGELVILYTNDVHNAAVRDDDQGRLGYAALAAYRNMLEAEGCTVVLIDGGDSIQGESIGTLSQGSYLVDIMNEVGYHYAVPGNHEFDFGMDTFLNLANDHALYEYIACNFIDLRTGEAVFEPYVIEDYNGVQVAYVGICTPETFSKSTPSYFQDEEGNYIYSFAEGNDGQDLYDCVQKAIDDAKKEGADFVICVGHVGIDPTSSPWTSTEIIANTTGMVAFLDAHSHSVIEDAIVQDKDGHDVALCSTGTKLVNIGEIRIDLNTGAVTTKLVNDITEDDEEILEYTESIYSQFSTLLSQVVAKSEVDLIVYNPENADERLIRIQETNLGDLCADAYKSLLGADVAFVNGGGIRAEIKAGDVTYEDIISVHPYGNAACLVEASGQEILDALEMAYRDVGAGECGGFLHVAGMTLQIDTSIPSGVVVDDKQNFVEVLGERRVSNVMVNGQPIDPEKIYTVASHNYMLKFGGDGFTMFTDNVVLQDEVMIDNQVLIEYIRETLHGVIPAELYGQPDGQGRILIVDGTEAE